MFALAETDAEGVSQREIIQGLLERSTDPKKRARYEAELTVPPLPPALDYLWAIFLRLHARRPATGFGPARLSFGDIDAFLRLTGTRLSPWEIEIVERLDDAALKKRDANMGGGELG